MKQMSIVCLRTYLKQVKSWAFFVMILAPFLFLGFSVLMGKIGENVGKDSKQIAIVNTSSISQALVDTKEYKEYKDQKAVEKALKDKDITAYVTVEEKDGQIIATYVSDQAIKASDKQKLGAYLQGLQLTSNLERAQLTQKQRGQVLTSFEIKEKMKDEKGLTPMIQQGTLFALIMVMYILMIIYSSVVAQDLASEKGAKIMEVILSSISASQYFIARMLGLLAVIVTHIVSYVFMFVMAYYLLIENGSFKNLKPLVNEALSTFSWMNLLFIVLGLFLYVVLAAVCGSLVQRQEDVNKAVQPVTFLVIFCLVISMTMIPSSDSFLAQVTSYIPVTSPFVMPIRNIHGNVETWQVIVSLLLLLATVLGLVEFIAKRYGTLVLQGENVSLLQIIKRTVQHQ